MLTCHAHAHAHTRAHIHTHTHTHTCAHTHTHTHVHAHAHHVPPVPNTTTRTARCSQVARWSLARLTVPPVRGIVTLAMACSPHTSRAVRALTPAVAAVAPARAYLRMGEWQDGAAKRRFSVPSAMIDRLA